jgi:hypothetical protein
MRVRACYTTAVLAAAAIALAASAASARPIGMAGSPGIFLAPVHSRMMTHPFFRFQGFGFERLGSFFARRGFFPDGAFIGSSLGDAAIQAPAQVIVLAAAPPPAPPPRPLSDAGEHLRVEKTEQGVVIVRGPGSHHLYR